MDSWYTPGRWRVRQALELIADIDNLSVSSVLVILIPSPPHAIGVAFYIREAPQAYLKQSGQTIRWENMDTDVFKALHPQCDTIVIEFHTVTDRRNSRHLSILLTEVSEWTLLDSNDGHPILTSTQVSRVQNARQIVSVIRSFVEMIKTQWNSSS